MANKAIITKATVFAFVVLITAFYVQQPERKRWRRLPQEVVTVCFLTVLADCGQWARIIPASWATALSTRPIYARTDCCQQHHGDCCRIYTQSFSQKQRQLVGDGHQRLWPVGRRHSQPNQPPRTIMASNVTAIAAGYGHSLFLKSDGSLWGMGENDSGQLGNGTYSSSSLPIQISFGNISNITAIAAGSYHSLFSKAMAVYGVWVGIVLASWATAFYLQQRHSPSPDCCQQRHGDCRR